MIFRKLLIAYWCALTTVTAMAAEPPARVLTTIKPLQLLVLAVTGDDPAVHVDVLLPPQASPHDYQLKPSDRAKIAGADAVFWVGPGLELFLERVLTSSVGPKFIEAFQPNGSHHQDAHIWMDPLAATEIADRIAAGLARLRPEQAAIWQRNAADLRQRLIALDRELSGKLRGIQPKRGYLVSHDAFVGFETRYGLRHVDALSDGEERPPGPRRMATIKEAITHGAIGCALLEPQYDRKLVQALLDGSAVQSVVVDTLAGEIAADRQGLEQFYRGLGRAFEMCLKK